MQAKFVRRYSSLLLIALACKEDPDPSRAQHAATPAINDAGTEGRRIDAAPAEVSAVPEGLSCGGLVGGSTCDPVTAWPCDTNRETCGYSLSAGAYRCIEIPNQQPHCAACDMITTFCAAGLLCNTDLGCERFCCTDTDCPIGRCVPNAYGDDDVAIIGVCEEETSALCIGGADAGADASASE